MPPKSTGLSNGLNQPDGGEPGRHGESSIPVPPDTAFSDQQIEEATLCLGATQAAISELEETEQTLYQETCAVQSSIDAAKEQLASIEPTALTSMDHARVHQQVSERLIELEMTLAVINRKGFDAQERLKHQRLAASAHQASLAELQQTKTQSNNPSIDRQDFQDSPYQVDVQMEASPPSADEKHPLERGDQALPEDEDAKSRRRR